MNKVYLVIEWIERGMGCDEKPYKVYQNRDVAFVIADKIHGYVKELDYVQDADSFY